MAAEDTFQTTVGPFLKKHCYACHGPEKQESRIRYDQIDGFQVGDRHLWTMVHEQLSAGDMPPDDRTQPSDAEKQPILAWIEKEQRALGTGSTRRLNRRELSAALQDLSGSSVDYAAALPGDGKIGGFDTGVDGLQDAASSVTQIMRITRRVVDALRFLEPSPSKTLTADLRTATDPRKALEAWKDDGAEVKVREISQPGMGLLLQPRWLGERDGLDIYVPPPASGRGVLRLKLVVSALKYFDEIPNSHLSLKVGGNDVDYREITATLDEPQELVYEVQLEDLAIENRGVKISLQNLVEIPYAVDGFENEDKSKPQDMIPGGAGLFRPLFDRKKTPPEQQPVPFVVLQRIEIDPNYVAAWPPKIGRIANPSQPESHSVLHRFDPATIEDNDDNAQRLLGLWIERAWRRPAGEGEQQRFLALYRKLRGQEMSFDDALRAVFQSVLLSGPFRYLSSPADPDPVVAQHAIASRLSFMLVGTPPDDELRQLAAAGKLREPAVLDAQVDRLLADPHSDAFFRPFVTQWLEMDQPITLTMNYFQKQDFRFGRYLKASMREETIAYFGQLLAENRPVRELIDSDWTMMNEALARHYGYAGLAGGQLRKVTLRDNDPRGGGILGHAGIQSMLCWMGDNWVIYRGAWALRHIFDDPPPPPPLEVPELDPSAGNNRGKTFKQLLQQHQENAKCAVCHKSMDPLGFAFQNFDISGRWRDLEYESYVRNELDGKIEWRGAGQTRPVDATGRLPRGEQFRSYAECKELIVEHYLSDIVRGLMKNLMLYATGRKADVDDLAEIRSIMQVQAGQGFPMCDLLKAVVRSQAFLDH